MTHQTHKIRKPLDLDLKRQVENSGIKTHVTLGLSESVIKILDNERKNENFYSRSNACEYYMRKGISAAKQNRIVSYNDITPCYVSIKLTPEMFKTIDTVCNEQNVSRGVVAEFYLNAGLAAEGLV